MFIWDGVVLGVYWGPQPSPPLPMQWKILSVSHGFPLPPIPSVVHFCCHTYWCMMSPPMQPNYTILPQVNLRIYFPWSLWPCRSIPLDGTYLIRPINSRNGRCWQSPATTGYTYLLISWQRIRHLSPCWINPVIYHPLQHLQVRLCSPSWWGDLQHHIPILTLMFYRHPGSYPQPPLM